MDDAKRKRLEAAGYTIGNAVDILGIPPARKALIEFRISASLAVRRLRAELGLTQAEAGKLAGVAQAQVARIEGVGAIDEAKGGTSTDLMLRLLFGLGGTVADLEPVPKWEPEPAGKSAPARPLKRMGKPVVERAIEAAPDKVTDKAGPVGSRRRPARKLGGVR